MKSPNQWKWRQKFPQHLKFLCKIKQTKLIKKKRRRKRKKRLKARRKTGLRNRRARGQKTPR